MQVLSQLDATDLCLAGCVNEFWSSLANVDVLWKGSVGNIIMNHCKMMLWFHYNVLIVSAIRGGATHQHTEIDTR